MGAYDAPVRGTYASVPHTGASSAHFGLLALPPAEPSLNVSGVLLMLLLRPAGANHVKITPYLGKRSGSCSER